MSTPTLARLQRVATRSRGPVFGVGGQLTNAATNVATAYLASLLLAPAEFGDFVLAFACVTVVLAAGRGLVGTTMMVHLPAQDEAGRDAAVRSALGTTLLGGLAATAVLALVATVSPVLWAFVPWVAVALLQDVGRYAHLAVGEPGRALVLDLAWVAVQASALVAAVLLSDGVGLGGVATAWGLGALGGFLAFAATSRLVPSRPGPWIQATRDVAGWFTATAILGQVEIYLVLLLTGLLLAPADVGGVRAVQLLAYQPAVMLVAAMLTVLQPLVVRARDSADALRGASRRVAVAMIPLIGALALLALLREPLMTLFFPGYVAYAPLVVPIAAQSALVALAVVPLTVLRGLRRGGSAFSVQFVRTLVTVVAAAAGMWLGGVDGLAWALAACMAGACVQAFLAARRAVATLGLGAAAEAGAGAP